MALVEIYFVTNRNYIPGNEKVLFGAHFNPDGVAALRFGKAVFDVEGGKAAHISTEVYPDAKVMPGQTTVPPSGSGQFLEDLRTQMLADRDTLVFIHGFNVSFVAGLEAGALLAASLPSKENIVVFSWPSDGEAIPYMSYYSDREDARASGPALARAYLKLFDFVKDLREAELQRREKSGEYSAEPGLCERKIHILAHSMGNYVLRHGIQAICVKDSNRMVRMFDQVVMAAADEDDDTFELDYKLRVLPSMARRITVYHNRHDRALIISDKTKANPDRLGSEGPRMLDLLPKKVVIVDCGLVAAEADPRVQHSYYIHCPQVAADMSAVLADVDDANIRQRKTIREGRAYQIER
jgi:esterase/lipase superfamily enzyme